ncbi:molecular chaperone DnaK [Leucobacter insecticola]|uniref:Molecular chaperone DnaK n=1 Tax=Leucobacter insecticola TaxID=2714934 RepID=A0A6G8FI80_9MICO|nr:TraR/DksA C4-type zinc finger protein [Leucobacter insecticola]QIM16003.1 molecular chaperone DnaK [Leucobacter insecticola]
MSRETSIRALLVEEREQLLARFNKRAADLEALVRARRNESDDDEHDPEGETLSAQWSMRAGLLESAREDLQQADNALKRLDAGQYGECAACNHPIPAGQLEVRPFRERCVACTP